MYKELSDSVFDSVLKTAFNEYVRNQIETEPTLEELDGEYPINKKAVRTAKRLSKKVKYGKPPIVVYLQRACIIALVCLCAFFASLSSTAEDEHFWIFNKDFFTYLPEKVENFFGGTTVNKTSDVRKYDSLRDLKENEDLNGALLPLSLEGKYDFVNVSFSDYGESQIISFDIIYDKNRIGYVEIDTLYNGSFRGEDFNIGGFDVKFSQYDNVHQFEFVYDGNLYLVKSMDYDVLLEITESLE